MDLGRQPGRHCSVTHAATASVLPLRPTHGSKRKLRSPLPTPSRQPGRRVGGRRPETARPRRPSPGEPDILRRGDEARPRPRLLALMASAVGSFVSPSQFRSDREAQSYGREVDFSLRCCGRPRGCRPRPTVGCQPVPDVRPCRGDGAPLLRMVFDRESCRCGDANPLARLDGYVSRPCAQAARRCGRWISSGLGDATSHVGSVRPAPWTGCRRSLPGVRGGCVCDRTRPPATDRRGERPWIRTSIWRTSRSVPPSRGRCRRDRKSVGGARPFGADARDARRPRW